MKKIDWESALSFRILFLALLVAVIPAGLVALVSSPASSVVLFVVFGAVWWQLATTTNPLYCPHCRKRVKMGASACHHCGREVVGADPPETAFDYSKPKPAAARCPDCEYENDVGLRRCNKCAAALAP